MDDLISRKTAIAEFSCCELTPDGGIDANYAIDFLKQLPSAQPEPRWIPCSERLPEVGQDILMSIGGMYTAEGYLREDGDWAQFRWDTIQRKIFVTFHFAFDMVGAWMPLPKPYKEEDNDRN